MAVYAPALLPSTHEISHGKEHLHENDNENENEDFPFENELILPDRGAGNIANSAFHNKIKSFPNSSFNSLPTQMGPLVPLPEEKAKIFPRQELLMEKAKKQKGKPLSRKKYRKKVKFRLIPTFKNLEKGHFIGRSAEIKLIRKLFMNNKRYFKRERQDLDAHNALSILSIGGANSVGKSSLAYLYLMAYEQRYKYIFWINSNSILSDIRDILLYHLTNEYEIQAIKSEQSAEILRMRFLHFIKHIGHDFLLVIDDFDDLTINLYDWIPHHLENVRSSTLDKISHGHVIITTNQPFVNIDWAFRSFETKVLNIELLPLENSVIAESLTTKFNVLSKDEDSVLKLLATENLNNDIFGLNLLNSLRIHSGLKWNIMYKKYVDAKDVIRYNKIEKLKAIFKNLREKEEKALKRKHFHFTRKGVMDIWKKQKKLDKVLVDLDNFNSDLFEVELLLQKFKLAKYFTSLVEIGKHDLFSLASVNLAEPSTYYWRKLRYKGKKRKLRNPKWNSFNLNDENDFLKLSKYVIRQVAQEKITISIKLWLEFLQSSSLSFHNKVFEILKQMSCMSTHRIPVFLFPELLLDEQEDVYWKDATSIQSSSTITHNSFALSSLNLNTHVDTKIHGSSRFNGHELEFLKQKSYLTFFVGSGLLKIEKTGFVSLNPMVRQAIVNSTKLHQSHFEVVLNLVRKVHVVGFEFNFEEIVGESLSLLRNNPNLVKNAYNRSDVNLIESLSDVELQTFCTHDFNLKLNMIPHFEFIRKYAFKRLLSNPDQVREYNAKCNSMRSDLFGLRHKQVKDFNKYSRMLSKSENRLFFNASSASLFPEFASRDLTLVRADIMFNEGLLLMNVPFRESRFTDAFNCFKTSYNLFSHAITANSDLSGRDLTMAKCCFYMAHTLLKMDYRLEALKIYKLSLRHFQDFHGEFTNHIDTARALSCIGRVYHDLAVKANDSNAKEANPNLVISIEEILNKSNLQEFKEDAQSYEEKLLFNKGDVDSLSRLAMKYHHLCIHICTDILGKRPLNASFAQSLSARAQTFMLQGDFEAAEEDLNDALAIFQELAETSPVYNKKLAQCAIFLARVSCQKEGSLEGFMKFLNLALVALSKLSTYEIRLLQAKAVKEVEEEDLTTVDIAQLAPHDVLSECLVDAADILLSSKNETFKNSGVVLLRASYMKYKELFGSFKHPRIREIKVLINSVRKLSS